MPAPSPSIPKEDTPTPRLTHLHPDSWPRCYIFWLKKKKKEKEAEKEVLGHPELPRRGSCVSLGAARLATPSLAPGASHPKEYRIKGRDSGGPPSAPSVSRPTQSQAPGTEQQPCPKSPPDPQSFPYP